MTLRKKNPKITVDFYFAAAVTVLLILKNSYLSAAACVLIHESGHLFCMYALSLAPKEIRFHLCGIDIVRNESAGYLSDALISLCGPLFNIAFSLFGFPESLALGLVSLLPVCSLDGGRILFCILAKYLSPAAAEKTVVTVSYIILVPLSFFGFSLLFFSGYNFTLLLLCVYLMLGLIVKGENDF